MMDRFEPKIIGFLCNWCSYEGADSAGRARKVYPPNLRVIKVMCSGRVDPQFILEAFKEGADGVMILGCHPGDCHYKEGNFQALKRYTIIRKMLTQFGIEEDRLRLDWISASDQDKFVDVVSEMTERVRELGPLPSLRRFFASSSTIDEVVKSQRDG
jgi:F420-non-reducing hydrogenase iron-sulfur subunit